MRGLVRANPRIAIAVGSGLIGIASIIIVPAIFVGVLNILGFGAIGPVAGSVAAAWQSASYGGFIASGSLFALAQSAAMGGVVVASVEILVASATLAASGIWLLV